MIKAKKKIQTTYTVEMDSDAVDQLDKWLFWASVVWSQCQQYPQLVDEIFHTSNVNNIPDIRDLNPDRNVVIRLALKSPEVEEV